MQAPSRHEADDGTVADEPVDRRRLPRLGLVLPRRRRFFVGAALAFVLVATMYVLAFRSFVSTQDEREGTGFGLELPPGQLNVNAAVLAADPVAKELALRLALLPGSGMLRDDGTLADGLVVTVNSSGGPSVTRLAPGERPQTIETRLALSGGDAGDYPWDRYVARLLVSASRPAPSPGEPGPSVPVEVRVTSRPFGYRVDSEREPSSFPGTLVRFDVRRSTPVRLFGTFGFAVILLLGLGAAVAGFSVIVERRLVEFPYLFFCATMLFSFPALRGALPGAPPIGALGDYLAFFWGIGLVAVTLLALLGRLIVPPRATPAEIDAARRASEPERDLPS